VIVVMIETGGLRLGDGHDGLILVGSPRKCLGTVSALGVGLLASRNRGSGGLGGVVPASGHPVRYSVSCSLRSTSQHMSVRHSAARGGMPLIVGDLGPARWDLGAPGKRLGKRLGRLGKVPDKY
jgi:hypothetical protein